MTNDIYGRDFYARRAALNIKDPSIFEEGALVSSPEFRERVVEAFSLLHGPGAELRIEIAERGLLMIRWFRPTDTMLRVVPSPAMEEARRIVAAVDGSLIQEAGGGLKKLADLSPEEFGAVFEKNLRRQAGSQVFPCRTFDDKTNLLACRLNSQAGCSSIIISCRRELASPVLEIGAVKDLREAESNLYPSPLLACLSVFNRETGTFHYKLERWGFASPMEKTVIVQWLPRTP